MKLRTQLTSAKVQIDEISRLEYKDGSITVYFYKSLEIGGEEINEALDVANPLKLDIAEIQDALDTIFAAALQARAKQLTPTPANATIIVSPDYRGFYDELITTQIFAIARQQAGENTQANAAYTDFALVLSSAVSGSANPIALQVCLDNMLSLLSNAVQQEDLSALSQLLEKHRIPIILSITQAN